MTKETKDKEYKLVLIEWLDSIGAGTNWQFLVDRSKENAKPITIKSVGYIIERNEDAVVIAPHLGPSRDGDGGQICGDMTIPVCCIVKEWSLFYIGHHTNTKPCSLPAKGADFPQYVFPIQTQVNDTESVDVKDVGDIKADAEIHVIGKRPTKAYPEIGRSPLSHSFSYRTLKYVEEFNEKQRGDG